LSLSSLSSQKFFLLEWQRSWIGFGWFQSGTLFQWNQKYKDRWLKPDGTKGREKEEVPNVN
jgi:hypothetical protein